MCVCPFIFPEERSSNCINFGSPKSGPTPARDKPADRQESWKASGPFGGAAKASLQPSGVKASRVPCRGAAERGGSQRIPEPRPRSSAPPRAGKQPPASQPGDPPAAPRQAPGRGRPSRLPETRRPPRPRTCARAGSPASPGRAGGWHLRAGRLTRARSQGVEST